MRLTPASGATRVTAVAVAALVVIAVLALAPGRARAIAPPQLSSGAAILVDADGGQKLFGQNPNSRRAIASTTKLMTALITLDQVHHLGRMFTQNDYVSAAEDSQIGLVPGERMSVHDLMLAMLLPSADDAAEDLAYNVGHGSVARFVGMMNAKARELGLDHTHYSTPIGLDTPGNYSSAVGPGQARALRHSELAVLPSRGGAAQRGAAHGPARSRGRSTATTSSARYHWINGVKTGHTNAAGYVLVGSGTRNGMTLVSAVLGTPSEDARDASTLALLDWGFDHFQMRTVVHAGQVLARPTVKGRKDMHARVVADLTYNHVFAKGAHVHLRVTAPQQLDGPLERDAVVGSVAVMDGRKLVRRIPLVLAAAVPAPAPVTSALDFITRPFTLVVVVLLIAARNRSGDLSARTNQGKTRRTGMIITVTLNAALDKTLEVPNFTPGRRHRTVDQTTMPGGKGVNVARALKRLGQPVIATGLAGGGTGNRIVEALNDEAILNGFARIREESRTNTAVLDPTTGQHTEVNERGPAVSPQELELFRDKLLYLAKGASMCVFAGSLPRGIESDVYAGLIREVRRLGVTTIVDTDGDPLRLAVRAEPDVICPNELEAEELVGHEFNDIDDRAQAVDEMRRLGASEVLMTVADGCFAQVREDGSPTLYRVRVEEQEARSSIGSGDAFLAGYVAARYLGRAPVECLRYGVACGAESIQHFGAGLLDPFKVDRLLPEVEAERLEIRAEIG